MRYIVLIFLAILNTHLWAAAGVGGSSDRWEERTLAAFSGSGVTKEVPIPSILGCTSNNIKVVYQDPGNPLTALAVSTDHSHASRIYETARKLGVESVFARAVREPENPANPTTSTRYLVEFIRFSTPEVAALISSMPPEVQEVARLTDNHGSMCLYDLEQYDAYDTSIITRCIIPNLSLPDYEMLSMALLLTRPGDSATRNVMVQLTPEGKFKFRIIDLDRFFETYGSIELYPAPFYFAPNPYLSEYIRNRILDLDASTLKEMYTAQGWGEDYSMKPIQFGELIQNLQQLLRARPTIHVQDLYAFSFPSILDDIRVQHDLPENWFFRTQPKDKTYAGLFLSMTLFDCVHRKLDPKIPAPEGFPDLISCGRAKTGFYVFSQEAKQFFKDPTRADKSAVAFYDDLTVRAGPWFSALWAARANSAAVSEINFSVGSLPFVVAEEGLSSHEPWGRWSDATLGRDVIITMDKPLPDTFLLNLEGIAFGDNVGQKMPIRIGSKVYEITLQAAYQKSVTITLDGILTSKITFTPPNPQSPGNGDTRHLAVGFKNLSIVDATGDATLVAAPRTLAAHAGAGGAAATASEINFSVGSPPFVVAEEGLSGREGWGRWSDASLSRDVVITMNKPLPDIFLLNLEGIALGDNVGKKMPIKIGSKVYEITLQAEYQKSIAVTLDGIITSKITFTPPNPQLPGNGDPRLLAVGFKKLSIEPR